jgi:adenosylmethionine-8-amino-7-oxononanoate aminotransferase
VEIQKDILRITKSHQDFNNRIKDHPKVTNIRQLGVIYAFDLNVKMERYGEVRNQLFNHFMDFGVFLRPLGNTIYILAPFIISEEELEKIYSSIESALEKF